MRKGENPYKPFGRVCAVNVGVVEGIYNGGFEVGSGTDAAGWTEGLNHTRNTGKRHEGSYSLKAACSGTSAASRTALFTVTPNTNYVFSAWVYNSLTSGAAYLDMNDIAGEPQMPSTRGKNAWEYVSRAWNSGTNTTVRVRCVTDGNPQGNVWFDDIRLTK